MFEGIKNILGMGPKVDLAELIRKGAIVVDVRSKGEFAGGHAKGSINIPLDQLNGSIDKLRKKNQVIITCCASGMRSGSAKSTLRAHGMEVHNAGSWQNVPEI